MPQGKIFFFLFHFFRDGALSQFYSPYPIFNLSSFLLAPFKGMQIFKIPSLKTRKDPSSTLLSFHQLIFLLYFLQLNCLYQLSPIYLLQQFRRVIMVYIPLIFSDLKMAKWYLVGSYSARPVTSRLEQSSLLKYCNFLCVP